MKVLVTGHHGYIGSVVVPTLAAAGHAVVGLDAYLYRDCDLFQGGEPAEELPLDVRDVEASHLGGFDAVVHLAALSNDPLGALDPDLTMDVNLDGTIRLARAAREAGVARFLFASSCSMYGATSDKLVDESAPLRPLTAYAESKVRAEEALVDLAGDGFSPVLLRNATAYGVSPRLRLDLVLNNLVGWAYTTGRVRILSDGTPWRPLIHVEDMAGALVPVLEAPRELVHAEAFNVGAEDANHQVRELAEIVAETVSGSEIEYAGNRDPDPRSYRVDFGKLRRTFPGFRPKWDARSGARELHDAYRAAGLDADAFESDRFTRLKRLRLLLERGELRPDLRRAA